jgi:hypothetical protein
VNKLLVAGAILIFLFTTMVRELFLIPWTSVLTQFQHWILDVIRLTEAFLARKSQPGGALSFYASISDPRNVLRTVVFVCQMVTLDSVLVCDTAASRVEECG